MAKSNNNDASSTNLPKEILGILYGKPPTIQVKGRPKSNGLSARLTFKARVPKPPTTAEIFEEYAQHSRKHIPMPMGVNQSRIVEVVQEALMRGSPIPDDYDWWAGLPPDSVS